MSEHIAVANAPVSYGAFEQDILPHSAERFARAAAEQRHNREFLAARGL